MHGLIHYVSDSQNQALDDLVDVMVDTAEGSRHREMSTPSEYASHAVTFLITNQYLESKNILCLFQALDIQA